MANFNLTHEEYHDKYGPRARCAVCGPISFELNSVDLTVLDLALSYFKEEFRRNGNLLDGDIHKFNSMLELHERILKLKREG